MPIARVSAISLCIHYVSQLLPIEEIYSLTHPSLSSPSLEDKRTWRGGAKPSTSNKPLRWTAGDILTAYANLKGWVTAKAGRPDINRAGNASMSTCCSDCINGKINISEVLRSLAEGKIKWSFWPPGHVVEEISTARSWILQDTFTDSEIESEAGSEDEEDGEGENSIEVEPAYDYSEDDGTSDDEEKNTPLFISSSRFGALSVVADDDTSE